MFVLTAFAIGLEPVAPRWLTVDESKPFQSVAHEGLASRNPDPARAGDVGPLLLSREQGFFCG
jgi:hypothetical protein